MLDGHDELKTQQAVVDELALDLLARQQPVAGDLRAMSERALAFVAEAGRAVAARDGEAAARLDHDDDQVDRLQQDLYRRLLAGTPGLDGEALVFPGADAHVMTQEKLDELDARMAARTSAVQRHILQRRGTP